MGWTGMEHSYKMKHKELRLGERFGQCMYNNGVYKFISPKVDVTKLELSESVSNLFTAIGVASKMIGEDIEGRFYFPKKPEEEQSYLLTLSLYGRSVQHSAKAPVFIWYKRQKDQIKVLILKCDGKLALKYPLEKIELSLISDPFNKACTTINNEQELLAVLKEILHNL